MDAGIGSTGISRVRGNDPDTRISIKTYIQEDISIGTRERRLHMERA